MAENLSWTDPLTADYHESASPAKYRTVIPEVPIDKGLGEIIANSPQFKNWRANPAGGRIEWEFPNWDRGINFGRATTTSSGLTSIGKIPGVKTLFQQPLTIAALLAAGETENSTVRYIQENTFTNSADAVSEAAAENEATFDLVETDAPVRKIGVWIPITEELASDYASVVSYINERLGWMVEAKLDNHLLNGSGAAPQIKGLLNFTGIQTRVQGQDLVPDALHKALTQVRSSPGFFGVGNEAFVLHPLDWENIALMKDKAGQYLFGGPSMAPYGAGDYVAAGSLWGLPVIETTALAQGTALAGAFRLGGQLFRRRGLTIEMTDSHSDFFTKGMLAIRATVRVALACWRVKAFCTVTGIS